MTKRKLTLGLAGALVAVSGMAACNEVTYNEGVILTYTDSSGIVHKYQALDLFEDYLPTSASASTIFNSVREVLIRDYFEQPEQATALATAKQKADRAVSDVRETAKNNADSNGTTYQAEWEKLLTSEGVENVDELFEKKLLDEETGLFEDSYYTTASYNAIRDGTRWTKDSEDGSSIKLDTEELVEKYGPVSKGYLDERLPYHVSHILVKLGSASNNEHTQDKIAESEARNLSAVVKEIAGAANTESGIDVATSRLRFGTIAKELSQDDNSAELYGDLGIMDKSTGFVPEFKLGVYAYEALYNNKTKTDADAAALLPDVSDISVDAQEIIDAFTNREIGQIPYGAFVALGTNSVAKDPDLGYRVNDNSDLFYARNILFNKYMNNHQIAVITPNDIPFLSEAANPSSVWNQVYEEDEYGDKLAEFNDIFAVEADADGNPITTGTPSDAYAALPGFQTDTTNLVDIGGSNVLTNEKGQVVLAVRAGTSSYQGIHFIVVDRSPLTQYAEYDATTGAFLEITEDDYNARKGIADVTSRSEYYTMEVPKNVPTSDTAAAAKPDAYYPFYKTTDNNGNSVYGAKSTFVNKLSTTQSDYTAQAKKVEDAVKAVVSDDNTYIFEELMVKGDIKFSTSELGAKIEELVTSYIKNTREYGPIDTMESFDKDWKTYKEYLDQQDVERKMNAEGNQRLISEVCAIGYGTEDAKNGTGLWAKGGACYDGK